MPSEPPAETAARKRSRSLLVAAVEPLLISDSEAAALIGISRAHFHRLRAAGKFGPRAIRLGRKVSYLRESVIGWCDAGCPDAATWHAMEGQGRRLRAV
jgi:predicted DNA-binding transcriptional regulator AlpA